MHGHWQIIVEGFNDCRDALYDEDANKRSNARSALMSYFDSIICEMHGKEEFKITSTCPTTPIRPPKSK